jgi:polar amino acid transport system substrate-binding protein
MEDATGNRVDHDRELLVGIDDAPPAPMQIGSPETGDFRGYEVDLLNQATRRLGARVRYRRALWSVIVGELVSGKLDLICSAATVTEARQSEVDFCEPHLQLQLAATRARDGLRNIDLAGERVGVRRGTTAESYVRKEGRSVAITLSESNDDLYKALAARELDVVVDDSPIASYYSHLIPGLQLAGLMPGTDAAYAIMVRKGNHGLRDPLNRVLREMERDGTLPKYRATWFVKPPEIGQRVTQPSGLLPPMP